MTGGFRTNTQLDQLLRGLLSGCRLVCEVDLPEDVILDVRKAWYFTQKPKGAFVREYPAIGVVFLVHWGVGHYRENEFWTDLRLGSEQSRVGQAFVDGLTTLELETFPQFSSPSEKARRFVAPILAHGGIPGSLAPDFLTGVLFPAMRNGHGSTGAELIARWRRDPPPALRTTVGRFLLYGGKTAVDLVDRLIALTAIPRAELAAGAAVGVPAHLVRAFLDVPQPSLPVARAALPRPTIELDPWGDEGPMLNLPLLVREVGEGLVWEVRDGSGGVKPIRAYPRREATPIPLLPSDQWVITAKRGGDIVFERTYECFGDNKTLCFDDAGRYLPDIEGIKADSAWVIIPEGVALAASEAEGNRPLDGEQARFFGPWSRYRATHLDLDSVDVLCALEGGNEIGRVPVLHSRSGRPGFVEAPLRDVHSQEGLEVRGALPALVLPAHAAWQVRLSGPESHVTTVVEKSHLPSTIKLADLVHEPRMGRWDVSATGALGSDFQASFLLVPELTVATPPNPLSPGVGAVSVEISSSRRDLKFPGRAPGESYTFVVPAEETHAEVWVFSRDRGAKAGLLITVPRIRWAFRGAVTPELGSSVLAFEPEDLGTTHAALHVGLGRGDVGVRVVLEDAEGERLQLVGAGRTTPEGHFRVELGGVRDTARACAARGLRLRLDSGETSVLLGHHAPPRAEPTASEKGGIFERDFTVTVLHVDKGALIVSGSDWEGIIYADRLPRPLDSYRRGETLTARVVELGERVKLDARSFDPNAFQLGEIVTATVVKPIGTGLLVTARGHDLTVDAKRLPPDRPTTAWQQGEAITGKVIYINPATRRIRLSVAAFEPGNLKPGDIVEGTVFYSGDVLLVTVGSTIGYVRTADRPSHAVRTGETIRARVLRIDPRRDQIDLTCRPFNAIGHAAGETVVGEITGIGDRNAWVRLPGGEAAFVPLEDDHGHDYARRLGMWSDVPVLLTEVDADRCRITARITQLPGTWRAQVMGDPADSPFAPLARLQRHKTSP